MHIHIQRVQTEANITSTLKHERHQDYESECYGES